MRFPCILFGLFLFVAATPSASAYVSATPPLPTTAMRQKSVLREIYSGLSPSILSYGYRYRGTAQPDTTGRALLSRSKSQINKRNLRRHVLGLTRGVDYRILAMSGDIRRKGTLYADADIPPMLVVTGGDALKKEFFSRPSRRSVVRAAEERLSQ